MCDAVDSAGGRNAELEPCQIGAASLRIMDFLGRSNDSPKTNELGKGLASIQLSCCSDVVLTIVTDNGDEGDYERLETKDFSKSDNM